MQCSFLESKAPVNTILLPAWITEDSGPPNHPIPSILHSDPSFPKGVLWCGCDRAIHLEESSAKPARSKLKMTTSCAATAAFVLLLLCASCVATGLPCDPNGSGASFGYIGPKGPAHWGTLNPGFKLCARGTRQSPINISTAEAVVNPALQPLHRDYTVANATLVDNIVNIGLHFNEDAGSVRVYGKVYKLKHLHWHSPSEHTIDGQRFPVELHMVHVSDDGNITVLAMLYRFGSITDPLLWQVQDKLAKLHAGCKAEEGTGGVPAGVISLWSQRLYPHSYYRYAGSFTTPPCTENVIWSVMAQAREMTSDQAAALMKPLEQPYKHNNRPTQAKNGRVVQAYYNGFMDKKTAP